MATVLLKMEGGLISAICHQIGAAEPQIPTCAQLSRQLYIPSELEETGFEGDKQDLSNVIVPSPSLAHALYLWEAKREMVRPKRRRLPRGDLWDKAVVGMSGSQFSE